MKTEADEKMMKLAVERTIKMNEDFGRLEHCFNCEHDYPKGEHDREMCQYLNR